MSTRREISPISRWVLEGLFLLEIPYIWFGRFQKSELLSARFRRSVPKIPHFRLHVQRSVVTVITSLMAPKLLKLLRVQCGEQHLP